MSEVFLSIAFIFALDLALIAALVANYRRLRFDFLRYVGLALAFDFARHAVNLSLGLYEDQTIPVFISGELAILRGALLIHAVCALTNTRFRWVLYPAFLLSLPAVSITAVAFGASNQVAWYAAMAPLALLHAAAMVIVLIRTRTYTQGRIALAFALAMSALALVLMAVFQFTDTLMLGVFYLVDAISLILAAVTFIIIALEVVQATLENAKHETAESEARYRHIFESAFDGIVTVDGAGTIIDMNPQAEAIFGWRPEKLLGRNFAATILDESDAAAFRSAIERLASGDGGDGAFFDEVIAERNNGESFPVELIIRRGRIGALVSLNIFARDLTAQKEAEEERTRFDAHLQHTQKLESLGVLAGGIAHDFNNLLNGILGFAGLAKEALEPGAPARDDIREIETIAEQAADLIRQLLAYSGRGAVVQKPCQLSLVIKESERLLRSSVDKKAELTLELERTLPLVKCDASQISQIVLNLVSNASDALEEQPGAVALRTGVEDVSYDMLKNAVVSAFERPGPAVYIEVEDTGCGMNPETCRRMFDPFFTTKFAGRGLGMAALIGIVRSHGAAVLVDSAVGRGTLIRVLFPIHSQTERVAYLTPPEPESHAPDREWTATGLALVVDDEAPTRTLARQVLEKRGFTVVTASDGSEAVECFKQNRDELAFVLLDLTMPKMGGAEALTAMRRIRDDVPIVLSSGYSESIAVDGRIVEHADGFIQKPYRASALAAKVHDALLAQATTLTRNPTPPTTDP